MTRVLGLVVAIGASLAVVTPAHAESNGAFLGISWYDNPGPCEIQYVISNGPAEAADIRDHDEVRAFDGVQISTCQMLTALINTRVPGDTVRLDLWRDHRQHIVATAVLSTRAGVVHQLVGQTLAGEAQDYSDDSLLDLQDLRGQTTIVALTDLMHCNDCGALIRRVGDLAEQRRRSTSAPQLVTVARVEDAKAVEDLRALHLYLGDRIVVALDKQFERTALDEANRVFFFVLDRDGVVRFIAPIAPDDDAADAAIEDVLTAAEQAERAHPTSR